MKNGKSVTKGHSGDFNFGKYEVVETTDRKNPLTGASRWYRYEEDDAFTCTELEVFALE